MIEVRRSSSAFTELHLGDDLYFGARTHADTVHWYHPDGSELTESDWNAPSAQALVMEIIARESQEHWLVLFNSSAYDIHFRLPEPAEHHTWALAADTAFHDGKRLLLDDLPQLVAVCSARAMKLLRACSSGECDVN